MSEVRGASRARPDDAVPQGRLVDLPPSGPPGDLRPLFEAVLTDAAVWEIVEGAPDGLVMIDREGRMVLVNRRVEELFGWDRGELLGQPVEVLLPEAVRGRHRAHRVRYRADPHPREMGSGLELEALHRNGSIFPVEVSLSPIDAASSDGEPAVHYLAIVRDVSTRRRTEAQVELLRTLLDSTLEGVFIAHPETLAFSYVNEGLAQLTGYSRPDLMGMSPLHLTPHLDRAGIDELVRPVVTGAQSAVACSLHLLRSDGMEVECEVLIQQLESRGDRWLFAHVRDLSERLRAEAQLREAEQELVMLADRERIAADLHDTVIQSLFAVGMSLQGAISLAPSGDLRERLSRNVDQIDQAIRDVRATVFRLHAPPALSRGVQDAVGSTLQEAARSLGFAPRLIVDGPVESRITDEVRLELLPTLREGLSNVARHAQASSVRVSLLVEHDEVILEIRDDGTGIPVGHRPGEGLRNMAQRAARLGGTCSFSGAPGGGTVVRWSVPVRLG
jgi:PAS domain S-box-containing protein